MAGHAGFAALFFKLLYPNIPYFLELQDGRPIREMKSRRPSLRFLWSLYTAVYTKADTIKCISTFIATEVRRLGYRGSLRVIPNGVDVEKFSLSEEAASAIEAKLEALKKKYNKQSGDIFLFTASRLVLSRGVEDVIQSLTHLPPNVKFLIAGEGEDKEKLLHIATQLKVRERVIFVGYVSHDDLPLYLKISDIFVRPSIIEGMGNAFIEAFAAGIPVIGTPVGGIPDFLFDPEKSQELDKNAQRAPTGLFCEVQNPESIARAVHRYIDEPVLRTQIVANTQKLATEKYDWRFIARDMKDKIFNSL
jgi:glycosyltransferase involved in cell wall biosynthesis